MRKTLFALPVAALAACTPPEPSPTLPAALAPTETTRDTSLQVGASVGAFFRNPRPNEPAEAARALAELEWLASSLPQNPQWMTLSGTGMVQLGQARNEARAALGIPRTAPSQAVVNGLTAASAALQAGDRAAVARALPRGVFTLGPEATVAKLAEPPRVPSVIPALTTLSASRSLGGGSGR